MPNNITKAEVSIWLIFGVTLLIYLSFAWVTQEFIYSDSLYYRSYSGTLTNETIEGILGFQSRFWWTGYAIAPIVLLLKFLFTSICISVGAMFTVTDIKFKDIFKTAMLAEGVFIIAQVIFMISLYVHLDDITLQNTAGYFPLSALSFIGIENVNAQWAIYPLQTINLFEVMYITVISWLLSKQWKPDFTETLNVVIPSYGLGLLLWIVLVAFLTLQIS
jgi:hypothetical protein